MRRLFFIVCIILCSVAHAQSIPGDWMGDWYGVLEIKTPKGKIATINMELHLSKTDTANNWSYRLVYDNGNSIDERRYNLIKSDSLPGLYEINENNGIILNEVMMGNKMFSRFEVMDNVIYGITTYEKDRIIWEIVSDNENISFQSGGTNEDIPLVTTYFPTNYQRAILTKKKPKSIKKPTTKEKDKDDKK